MSWPQTGATHYHAQLGLSDKGRAIKELVVCNSWDLEPYDLLNGLALGCYQPSPEVLIVFLSFSVFTPQEHQGEQIFNSTDINNELSSHSISVQQQSVIQEYISIKEKQ